MNSPFRWIVLALSVVVAVAAPAARADVDLSSKWKVGEELVFSYTSDSTRRDAVPAMQAQQEQRTRQEMTIRRKVLETGPAGTTLEVTFQRIKVVVTQGRMFMLFDSARPPDADRSNVLEDAVKPLIDVPLRVKVNADGVATEVSGFPQPRTVDGAVRPLVVDEELVRNSLSAMYGLQKKPATAKLGDRWMVEEELPGETGTVLAIRHQRKIDSADPKEAVITGKGTAEVKVVAPGTQPKLLISAFDCTSTFHWDHAQGKLGWMVLEQKIEMAGVVKQARSEHLSTVRITLASEGFTPPPPPPSTKDAAAEPPGSIPPGSTPAGSIPAPRP